MVRAAQNIRRVIFEHDAATGTRAVHDIIVDEIPAGSDDPKAAEGKARAAARRKLLRHLDRQIDQLLDGDIDEISLVLADS